MLEPSQELIVATISTLEISRLMWGGRLELDMTVRDWVDRALSLIGARTFDLCHPVAAESYLLPEPFHKDPADRILVATTRVHSLTLLTADERILEYPHVSSLDARL